MPQVKDISGQRFGRLLALHIVDKVTPKRGKHWMCVCDCGARVVVDGSILRAGMQSCGCARVEMLRRRNEGLAKHHMHGTPTYLSWQAMKARCQRATAADYARYGGRGITVCDRWQTFDGFLADMGVRPDHTSIDRIDVNGNYEPGNCRWATRSEQCRNKRGNTILELHGEFASMAAWAERTGINYNTLHARIRKGWSHEHALTCSLGSRRG